MRSLTADTMSKPMKMHACQTVAVREHFDDTSESWSTRYGRTPQKMSDLDLLLRRDNIQRLLQPLLPANGRRLAILDLGCGTGDVLDGMPRERFSVCGVDLAAKMVAAAAVNHPSDHFAVADATLLPIAPSSIDVVICSGMLEYTSTPENVLDSIQYVLRPGGHLIVSFPNKRSLLRTCSRLEIALEHLILGLIDKIRGRKRPAEPNSTWQHTQWTIKQARRLLRSAGLHDNAMTFNTYGLWGRLGRTRLSLLVSHRMSRRFGHRSLISVLLASTMVMKAQKLTS